MRRGSADEEGRVYPKGPPGRKPKDVTGDASITLEVVAVPGATGEQLGVSPEAAEEAALVARCLAGDSAAYRPLVQKHQRVVFSVATRMLGSRADAEDVAQQAFVDAYAALDRFRAEGRKNAFANWVIRIAINRCKDILKSKRRTEEPLGDEAGHQRAAFAHQPRDPEAALLEASARRALEAALLAVPAKYREVLVLKDIEELPYEEIRAILDLPLTTLKIRVVRAREMLRAALGDGKI
jgi:RNA polymerase sigma-70 factor (ECF subfamily)